MGIIRFIGLNKLSDREQLRVKTLAERYGEKLIRAPKDMSMVVNVKEYDTTGKRVKYSLRAGLRAPKFSVASSAFDWDLSRALHKTFKKLEREMEHKYRIAGHKDIRGIKHGRHVGRKVQRIKNRQ